MENHQPIIGYSAPGESSPTRGRPRCRSPGTRPRTSRRGCGRPPPRTRSCSSGHTDTRTRTQGLSAQSVSFEAGSGERAQRAGKGVPVLLSVLHPHQSKPPASAPSQILLFSGAESSTIVSVASRLRSLRAERKERSARVKRSASDAALLPAGRCFLLLCMRVRTGLRRRGRGSRGAPRSSPAPGGSGGPADGQLCVSSQHSDSLREQATPAHQSSLKAPLSAW